MVNGVVVNDSVTIFDNVVSVASSRGESRVPLAILCNLSEFSARITVAYLGGTLSGPEYVSMLKYNKEWS
ncbi:hypothetical protein [Escherichia phage vB-EcoP-XT32]|uniref:Uncharacterized protein n=1 Tax=Escherichia phage vB-EcoP-XT18 TaxID=3093889 RepID=A0ABZ0S3Y4_9CAUD|nr:hypothetical protein [Escherichia phage vB-EcoP-XT18]WPK41932.1 hypothetical protein [Escherichia phage vB-EcoP-XT32]